MYYMQWRIPESDRGWAETMDKSIGYVIKKDSFVRIEKKEEQIAASYERGLVKDVLHSLKENKLAMICSIILLLIILASVFAPFSSYDPDKQDLMQKLMPPSREHWFGTDELGRDYFTRALYGGRISLSVGVLSMLLSTIIGTVIGTVSGYMGGKTDMFLMRFTDILCQFQVSYLWLLSIPCFLQKYGQWLLFWGCLNGARLHG